MKGPNGNQQSFLLTNGIGPGMVPSKLQVFFVVAAKTAKTP